MFIKEFTNHRNKTKEFTNHRNKTKEFTNHRNKTNGAVYFCHRYKLKNLACTYESTSPQSFRTTTGIQSWPSIFDKLRLVMTCSTNLGVMQILCNFRLVPKRKAGLEIPVSSRLEVLKKFSAKIFVSFSPVNFLKWLAAYFCHCRKSSGWKD